jgi:hypothetical protein
LATKAKFFSSPSPRANELGQKGLCEDVVDEDLEQKLEKL